MGGCGSRPKSPPLPIRESPPASSTHPDTSGFDPEPKVSPRLSPRDAHEMGQFSDRSNKEGGAKAPGEADKKEGMPESKVEVAKQQSSLVSPRRRLTVSTISTHGEEVPTPGTQADALNAVVDKDKRVDQAEPKASDSGDVLKPGRSKIKHFNEPSMELLNEKNGRIKDVSVDMIMDLVSASKDTFMIFGSDPEGTQKGFDNKRKTVVGTMAESWDPTTHGIGYACKKGLKPESPNQDDFFFMRVDDWTFFGVFDGHGPCGHAVSSFVHRALPFLIIGDLMFETDPCSVMRRAFRKAHHLVEALSNSPDSGIDSSLSGTTGTCVLHRDNKLFIAHVGDSRSVMAAKAAKNNVVEAVDLTIDHKPTDPNERKRIEAAGGEVRQLEGDIPHRVFMKRRMYPGLAMSRAIGDSIGSAVGVVSDPDVRIVDLGSAGVEQFVVVASDGVWEFISSQEAVDFICQKGKTNVQKAADFVAYESWRRWVEEEENVVDDVTCIVFWFDGSKSTSTDLDDSKEAKTTEKVKTADEAAAKPS